MRYSEKEFDGNLEFLLMKQSDIFSGRYRNNIAKGVIGAILNKVFLREKKKYEFTQYVSRENSNIDFFVTKKNSACRGCDLSSAHLIGAEIDGADLTGADLSYYQQKINGSLSI